MGGTISTHGSGSGPMRARPLGHQFWMAAVGLVSIVPCFYFWIAWMTFVKWGVEIPADAGLELLGILLGLPLSVYAAIRWTKWMILPVLFNSATLVFVASRLL